MIIKTLNATSESNKICLLADYICPDVVEDAVFFSTKEIANGFSLVAQSAYQASALLHCELGDR